MPDPVRAAIRAQNDASPAVTEDARPVPLVGSAFVVAVWAPPRGVHQPWLDQIVVSSNLHLYVSQSARGELVMGAALDPYELHSTRSTLDFAETLAAHMLDLFPFLSDVKVNRQWAGMADMTPDFAPIMGLTPVRGFYLDSGWGTWGFKATPVCGKTMSYTVAKDADHPLIKGFAFDRFARYALTAEKGAASVGH